MQERHYVGLLLIGYLLITCAYNVINPLFEAPDEHWHYFTTQYIAETGTLPFVGDPYDEWLSQEAAQPPLYYWLGGLLIAPIDTSEARMQVWLNPFAWIGDATAPTNRNQVVHTPLEAWPWQGYVLAAHLLRGLSTFLGMGTLLCIYASGRLLFDNRTGLLAMGLVAFWPQFNFIHASISNDSLIIFLASLTVWQWLRLWLDGVTRTRLLFLGVTIGLAALSKNAGITLLAYTLLILLLLAWRDGRYRLILETVTWIVLPALLIAGWLWWRNWILYGDLTATNQFVLLAGGDRKYTLFQVFGETPSLWFSLWAVFGWFNVRAPQWVYWLWSGLVLMAIIGLAWQWPGRWRQLGRSMLQQRWFVGFLLGGWFLAIYGSLVLFMLQTPAAQGRLLFPAIVPLALGFAYGLKWYRWGSYGPYLALITTLYCVVWVIPPIYAQPTAVATLPVEAVSLATDMGQGLTLVGAHVETETAVPGELIWLTLYWQAETIPEVSPEFVVELFGRDLVRIGNLHSYHGRGLYPATLWPPHQIIADRFAIRLVDEVDTPVLGRLFVRLVEETEGRAGVEVGQVKITPTQWPTASGTIMAQIGEGIGLTAVALSQTEVTPGEIITIAVEWQVDAPPNGMFTTLVHLVDDEQRPLATGDSLPLAGDYPTTVWLAGELISDAYSLTIPADLPNGRYALLLGMYDLNTLVRLPLTVNHERQPHDVYVVEWLEVGHKSTTP